MQKERIIADETITIKLTAKNNAEMSFSYRPDSAHFMNLLTTLTEQAEDAEELDKLDPSERDAEFAEAMTEIFSTVKRLIGRPVYNRITRFYEKNEGKQLDLGEFLPLVFGGDLAELQEEAEKVKGKKSQA